ncbi:hypothetical protein HK096_010430 [Nowakowskiella sp. JEL0078]|nr:hypothetical protein HK096_010430 [Nowakowskiella sp. JEL0078]
MSDSDNDNDEELECSQMEKILKNQELQMEFKSFLHNKFGLENNNQEKQFRGQIKNDRTKSYDMTFYQPKAASIFKLPSLYNEKFTKSLSTLPVSSSASPETMNPIKPSNSSQLPNFPSNAIVSVSNKNYPTVSTIEDSNHVLSTRDADISLPNALKLLELSQDIIQNDYVNQNLLQFAQIKAENLGTEF